MCKPDAKEVKYLKWIQAVVLDALMKDTFLETLRVGVDSMEGKPPRMSPEAADALEKEMQRLGYWD